MKISELPTTSGFGERDWKYIFGLEWNHQGGWPSMRAGWMNGSMSLSSDQGIRLLEQIEETLFFKCFTNQVELDLGTNHINTVMAAIFKFDSGDYATVVASCDLTGWDCRNSIDWYISDSLDNAIKFGLDNEFKEYYNKSNKIERENK